VPLWYVQSHTDAQAVRRHAWVLHDEAALSAATSLLSHVVLLCRLALNVDTDDVIHKLRNDETISWMKKLNL